MCSMEWIVRCLVLESVLGNQPGVCVPVGGLFSFVLPDVGRAAQ